MLAALLAAASGGGTELRWTQRALVSLSPLTSSSVLTIESHCSAGALWRLDWPDRSCVGRIVVTRLALLALRVTKTD